ncbi:MAG: alpha-L-fucosidase C-terminal domain-containing protein [Planctomycetota bacterium]
MSRGGVFLISLTPKGDGSIPDEEKRIMAAIGAWLRVNGEGIYGTRPWKLTGEGTPAAELVVERMKRGKRKTSWDYNRLRRDGSEVRFTRKGNTLYAFVIGWPESGEVTVKALARGGVTKDGEGIKDVSMLGSAAAVRWQQTAEGLTIRFPQRKPCKVAYGFRITVGGSLDDSPRRTIDDGVRRLGDFPVYDTKR